MSSNAAAEAASTTDEMRTRWKIGVGEHGLRRFRTLELGRLKATQAYAELTTKDRGRIDHIVRQFHGVDGITLKHGGRELLSLFGTTRRQTVDEGFSRWVAGGLFVSNRRRRKNNSWTTTEYYINAALLSEPCMETVHGNRASEPCIGTVHPEVLPSEVQVEDGFAVKAKPVSLRSTGESATEIAGSLNSPTPSKDPTASTARSKLAPTTLKGTHVPARAAREDGVPAATFDALPDDVRWGLHLDAPDGALDGWARFALQAHDRFAHDPIAFTRELTCADEATLDALRDEPVTWLEGPNGLIRATSFADAQQRLREWLTDQRSMRLERTVTA